MTDWLTLRCPLCEHPIGEVAALSEGAVRLRCYSRSCQRPVTTFIVTAGKARRVKMIDRRERKRVG